VAVRRVYTLKQFWTFSAEAIYEESLKRNRIRGMNSFLERDGTWNI
jgi:hypothetical protein